LEIAFKMTNQKHAFWQALIITILIFSTGILTGVLLENSRTAKISDLYDLSEISLLDIRLQTEIYSLGQFNCQQAINENIAFADRIFEEAKILDRYKKASRLTKQIQLEHKKYDMLRTMLLLNSIKIKQKCKNTYYEVVYFYDFNEPSFDTKAKQNVFSKLLAELKQEKGNEILLIPLAADNGISSINLLLEQYQITEDQLPLILINREQKITELQTIEELLTRFE